MQLSPLLKHCTFSYKRVFIPSFIMLYAENIGLRDCSGFLQIGSHFVTFELFKEHSVFVHALLTTRKSYKTLLHGLCCTASIKFVNM